MGKARPACVGGETNIRPVDFRLISQKLRIPVDEGVQCRLALGGKRQDRGQRRGSGGGTLNRGCLLNNNVNVSSAKTERAYAGPARLSLCLPWKQLSRHNDLDPPQSDAGVNLVEVEVGRNLAVLERENHFDQGGNAGSRFKMADIAFDRADDQGL